MLVKEIVESAVAQHGKVQVCDIGCGKGRYLKRLAENCPNNDYYASDISEQVMSSVYDVKEKRLGSMTNISFKNNRFNVVYACEGFEHAISLKAAFKEMYRITKPGGKIVIIDKPLEKLGQLEIYEWEQ